MPNASLRPCPQSRCVELVAGGGRCAVHKREQQKRWRDTPGQAKRIRGRKLQEIRAKHLRANPVCVMCRVKPATQLDHIVALANGGQDISTNRQGLCDRCHELKTAADLGYTPTRHADDFVT